MSFLRKMFQVDMAKETFSLPNRSLFQKIRLFTQAYVAKARNAWRRRRLSSRGRQFGHKLQRLIEADNLVKVNCPVCNAGPFGEGIDVWHGLGLCLCPSCGLRYISPRLSADALRKLYTKDYYYEYRIWLGHPVKNEAQPEEVLLGHKRFARAEMLAPPGKVLDIGCSTGEMLIAAREQGWEARGTDLNEFAVRYAREEYGLDVRPGPLSASTFPDEKFDLITMFDVIEHLPDPVEHMRLVRSLLKPDGLVVITTPNAGCREALNDFTKWKHLKPWEHICHYDSRVLKELGRLGGLELVDVDTELSSGVGYVGALMGVFRASDFGLPADARSIFVRAEGARGDTLLATPILKGLSGRFPGASIKVATRHPELLEGLHNVEPVPAQTLTDGEITLCARYEICPEEHIVDVMSRLCGLKESDKHIYYEVRGEEEARAAKLLADLSRPVICLHTLSGSRIKRWKAEYWDELAGRLCERGFSLVLVGSRDDTAGVDGSLDLRNEVSLREAIAVVKLSDAFVGLDSVFAHAAGAVKTPRVVLYGSTDPDRLACDLDLCPTVILRGRCQYLGCRHDCLPDQWPRNVECRLNTVACMDEIAPESVADAVIRLLAEKNES